MNMNKVCYWSPISFIYFTVLLKVFFFLSFRFCSRLIISYIFIETTEFTDSQSENYFGVSSIFVCGQNKKFGKTGRKNRFGAFCIEK